MKKELITGILLLFIGLITTIGIIISTKDNFLASVNPMNLKAIYIPYTKNSQSTVQGAIDDLYTKASTWVNPNDVYFDLASAKSNTSGTMLVSKYGICISRSKKVYCFRRNNFDFETTHMPQVFNDINCDISSSSITCNASDFRCGVQLASSTNWTYCVDKIHSETCKIYSSGQRDCD